MTISFSTAVRNAGLDSFETTVGTSAVLKIWTGSAPASANAADTGTALVSITLPSDWMAAAASGAKSKSGTWSASASAFGTAGYFRIYASDGTTCGMQGTCGTSGTDMILDNTSINSGQTVTVSTFTLTAGNA